MIAQRQYRDVVRLYKTLYINIQGFNHRLNHHRDGRILHLSCVDVHLREEEGDKHALFIPLAKFVVHPIVMDADINCCSSCSDRKSLRALHCG